MNKFVGKIVGDGTSKLFTVQHNLNTLDFVYNIRDVDGTNDLLASVHCVDPNTVSVRTLNTDPPLEPGETMLIVIIG